MMKLVRSLYLLVISIGCACLMHAHAAQAQNLLVDKNGDGAVKILAFGDSLTFGIGDGGLDVELGKRGYPERVSSLVGVPVDNAGVPGEEFSSDGVNRWVNQITTSSADIIILFEGANDAYNAVAARTMRDAFQRAVNAGTIVGKEVMLVTLPQPCCEHGGQISDSNTYSADLAVLSNVNEVPLIDIKRAWETTCDNIGECNLYNLPEGLHPNAKGYTVIAQTIAAKLVGVDIFSPGGAAELESALGLPQGTVIVKPDTSSKAS